MNIGTKVEAKKIDGLLTQSVPPGAQGVVTGQGFGGKVKVAFTVPGVLGGTRVVEVPVDPEQVAQL